MCGIIQAGTRTPLSFSGSAHNGGWKSRPPMRCTSDRFAHLTALMASKLVSWPSHKPPPPRPPASITNIRHAAISHGQGYCLSCHVALPPCHNLPLDTLIGTQICNFSKNVPIKDLIENMMLQDIPSSKTGGLMTFQRVFMEPKHAYPLTFSPDP